MAQDRSGASPVQIAHALKGVSFPVGKDELQAHAERNKADESVLDVLRRLPERQYANMADVEKGVGEVG